ncbi:MAG: hypothetical protein GXP28_07200 [Planctomycetes bacterium]|nr:hypothetical protein [Planctomycetota bacterium]
MAVGRVAWLVWLRDPLGWRRGGHALVATLTLVVAAAGNLAEAQENRKSFEDAEFSELQVNDAGEVCDVCTSEAAEFGQWESLVDDDSRQLWEPSELSWQPFDWVRHLGFRHSSTHGRHIGRGIPLEGTSWLNRPYHVDWFIGPLLGDDLIDNRVSQENVLIGGVRIGWDFDYYWGIEWRYARADPNAQFDTPQPSPNDVSYSLSDVSLIYYPWGDSKVRPYALLGIGAAQIDFTDDAGINHDATLATMPLGVGIQFHQASWLLWRLEVLNNLSFGDDGLSTMNNISITAGMELRLGARPASYWPWRTSRKIW